MKLENHILRDLRAGQSTADSIAQRLREDKDKVRAICDRLVTDKKLQTAPHKWLTIYRLPK